MSVRLKRMAKSKAFFCVSVALLMLAARLFFFDYQEYFKLRDVPSYDMYQGAAYFTTSMHSMRTSGDLAWWNPIDQNNGYAQYYQSFFAPLAPTTGHIVFIVWAQMIYLLSLINVSIPEYYQYLIVNYALLPFLYFVALAAFLSLIFRRRATIFFIMTAFTFSFVGWVNNTWFYFQEPFTMILLLGAAIAYLKRPTPQRLGWLLIAILIQLTSFNYWTVFNFWFMLIVLSTYAWLHPHQLRGAWLKTRSHVQAHPRLAAFLGVLITATMVIWVITLGSVIGQQSGNYERTLLKLYEYTFEVENLQVESAYNYSVQLFNPQATQASTYLGAFLIPLLALLPFYRWRRLEKWWFVSGIGALMIAFAPPLMLRIWDIIPFMDRVRHFFLLYPIYWKFSLVLLAGASLEIVLSDRLSPQERRSATRLMVGLMGIAGLVLLGFDGLLQPFTITDRAYVAVVVLIASLLIYRLLVDTQLKNRQLMASMLLILAFTDLSHQFWTFRHVESDIQIRWQEAYHNPKPPLPNDITEALAKSWQPLNPASPSDAFGNMPMTSDLWPNTYFVWHKFVFEVLDTGISQMRGPRLSFHTEFDPIPATDEILDHADDVPTILWLHHAAEGSTISRLEIGDNWHILESGMQSGEVYRWVENDAEFTITNDPTTPDQLRLEVEPGPGVEHQPFTLELRTSDEAVIGQVMVTNRQWVEFDLPPSENAVYHLHIEDGGTLTTNGDTRVLNFRVMDVGLDSRPGYNFLSNGHARPFNFEWGDFDYNTLAFSVDVAQSGWLALGQIYDPLWVITIDGEEVHGERANLLQTAIPIEVGQHEVRLEYRPLTRKLYWPASALLELTIAAIFVGLVLSGKPQKLSRR